MCVLRDLSAIMIRNDLAAVSFSPRRIRQIFHIITYCYDDLIRHQMLFHQIKNQGIRHLPHDKPCLISFICTLQDLTRTEAALFRLVCLHILHRAGLPAPCMIDQKLRVFSEKMIQQLFICFRASGHITHGIHTVCLQLFRIALPHTPEIRERSVRPKRSPVAHLIQQGDTNTIFISRNMLRHNVHRDLCKIKIGADPGRRCDARRLKDLLHDLLCKTMRRKPVHAEIIRHIHEHLIDGINDNILRSNILHVDPVDPRAVLHVKCHPRRCCYEVQFKSRICRQLRRRSRFSCKASASHPQKSPGVHLPYFSFHLKEPGTTRYPI